MGRNDDVEIVGQFKIGSGDAPPPARKSPGGKSKILFIGIALLIVLGVILLTHRAKNGTRQAVVPSAPAPASDAGGVSNNPEYRRKVHVSNEREARKAAMSGQSSVPAVGGEEKKDETLALAGTVARSQPEGIPTGQNRETTERQREQEESQALLSARSAEESELDKEVGGILSTWSGGGENLSVLAVRKTKSGTPAGIHAGSGKAKSGTPASRKNIPIIPAGKILYARIVNELNSDHPGPVLAQVAGGRFDGVKFLGSFQRDHGALVIKFDRVIYKDGETDSIGAYAVSPGTKLRSGLETDVNHHYLYRYGALLASAFLQGFGQSAMYSNSTAYPSTFGMPVIGFNGMTLLQQSEMGLGQAGMMLSGNAMNAFNRPTTVKVASDTPVGLLIVAETGQKLPKESSGGSTQPKPGLVNAPVPSMVPQPGYPASPMTGVYPGYGGGYGMPMMPMMP
jgi:intracellular multiplication protein IcmE